MEINVYAAPDNTPAQSFHHIEDVSNSFKADEQSEPKRQAEEQDDQGDCDYQGNLLHVEVNPYLANPINKEDRGRSSLGNHSRMSLKSCEQTIRQGWKTFCSVGAALWRIKDGGYFAPTHESFEDYCKDKLKIGHITEHTFEI